MFEIIGFRLWLIFSITILSSISCNPLNAEVKSYVSWIVGNPADFKLEDESVLDGGILLAGGSTDQDPAMRWFLQKARGGDVIVFRNAKNATSTSEYPTADGYNNYLFSELGVKVDSVETIFLNSRNVANNAEVVNKVLKAEAVFFTGGDQAFYYYNIQGTQLNNALNYLIKEKRVVIGGTSAGCAIQGQFGFSADFDTINSADALSNPYDKRITLRRDLLRHNYLLNTITDTHYDNPDRRGRHMVFLARMTEELAKNGFLARGIGVEEKTAVCVESDGRAFVYGSNSAHFLTQTRLSDIPEELKSNTALDWYRSRKAVGVYKITGTSTGNRYFNLRDWTTGSGGSWSYYYVDRGRLGTAN